MGGGGDTRGAVASGTEEKMGPGAEGDDAEDDDSRTRESVWSLSFTMKDFHHMPVIPTDNAAQPTVWYARYEFLGGTFTTRCHVQLSEEGSSNTVTVPFGETHKHVV